MDDYNKEVEEGLHITSMAGGWLAIIEGFAGMRVRNNSLHFTPRIPMGWEELIFSINFRQNIYKIKIRKELFQCSLDFEQDCHIYVNSKKLKFEGDINVSISI